MGNLWESEYLRRKRPPDMDCPAKKNDKKCRIRCALIRKSRNGLTGPIIVACQWNTAERGEKKNTMIMTLSRYMWLGNKHTVISRHTQKKVSRDSKRKSLMTGKSVERKSLKLTVISYWACWALRWRISAQILQFLFDKEIRSMTSPFLHC